jgi:hypothetical protein
MLKEGVEQYNLDPDDFTKKKDGTAADITTGNDGDVMIRISKLALSIVRNGNHLYIQITDNPEPPTEGDVNYHYYAHTRVTDGDRDYLYIGAYKGWTQGNGQLRSLSGKSPTTNQNLSGFRARAQANGSGYDLCAFYPLTLIQALFILRYKSLNSQAALGQGYVSGSSAQTTGATDTKGLYYGNPSTATDRVKCMGIEDLWGNIGEWIEGVFSIGIGKLGLAFGSFNSSGSGYQAYSGLASVNLANYGTKVLGTTELGFFEKASGGSNSTYFCDYMSFDWLNVPTSYIQNSDYGNGLAGGIFCRYRLDPSTTSGGAGGRLMYL